MRFVVGHRFDVLRRIFSVLVPVRGVELGVEVAACILEHDIPLDPAPDDVNFVNVAVDCELKTKDDPTAGWEIVDGNTLHLKGATCERVLTSGVKRVDLYYGCRPVQ